MSADDTDVAALVGRRIRALKVENDELRTLIIAINDYEEGEDMTDQQTKLWLKIMSERP